MSISTWSLIQKRRPSMRAFLIWDRNIESDMKEYRIYLCQVAQCTATKGATPTAVVPQPPDGTLPTWTLPIGIEGAAVVTAVDQACTKRPRRS